MTSEVWYEGPSWSAAETEVLRWGVVDAGLAVRIAMYAGVTPVYVLACVDFFREHRNQFKPSDLFRRLQMAANYRDPDDPDTWPAAAASKPRRRRAK